MLGLVLFLLFRGGSTLGLGLLFGDVPPGATRSWASGASSTASGPPWWERSLLVVGAGLIAVPLGVASGIWLAEFGRGRWGRWFSVAVSVLAAVPSIIMGLFGFGLILLLRQTLAPEANTCLLLSMVCLAVLVLPYLIRATETALTGIPEPVRLIGPSLGLSHWQTIWHVHLPAARRGIQSGVVLAVGRIAEDTAVILMTGVVASAGIPQATDGPLRGAAVHHLLSGRRASKCRRAGPCVRGRGRPLMPDHPPADPGFRPLAHDEAKPVTAPAIELCQLSVSFHGAPRPAKD